MEIGGIRLTGGQNLTPRAGTLNVVGASGTVNLTYNVPVFTGLTIANNGSGSIDIQAGAATDLVTTGLMVNTGTITKVLNGPWVVGSGNAGLDTGSLTNNTWYHVWLIGRTDTNVVDGLFSTSATSPTMPANYTLKRRIGAVRNGVGSVSGFIQLGDRFLWSTPVNDVNSLTISTTPLTLSLSVPTGLQLVSSFNTALKNNGTQNIRIYSTLQSDVAATINNCNLSVGNATSPTNQAARMEIVTNISGQIRAVADGNNTGFYITTEGWIDTRGK